MTSAGPGGPGASCRDRAHSLLHGQLPPDEAIRAIGEECPAEFFRVVVERLADSFEPAQAEVYERLMRVWLPPRLRREPSIPEGVERVYVLSRVTLGADIKIVSPVLDAMKRRFPEARIVFVSGPKPAELFAGDPRIERLEVRYPSQGSVSARIEFGHELGRLLEGRNRIVVDPDSRLTQLGLVPVCEPERYFHFHSRRAGGDSPANLSELTSRWLKDTFGVAGEAWVRPRRVPVDSERPRVAVSLGVGGNDSKRVGGRFEAGLIGELAQRFRTVWVDRGAGGEEAARVTAAAEASGAGERVRFHEGSFAEFVSVIGQSDLYVGYDSAGQHAAAAVRTPLVSVFAGAPSDRFLNRWKPFGPGRMANVDAGGLDPEECLRRVRSILSGVLAGEDRRAVRRRSDPTGCE